MGVSSPMDAHIDRGLPFEVFDFWREPSWTSDNAGPDSLFHSIDTQVPPLLDRTRDDLHDKSAHFTFEIPDLVPLPDATSSVPDVESEKKAVEPTKVLETNDITTDVFDISSEYLLEPISRSNIYTWEAFQATHSKESSVNNSSSFYLSEAGPLAFDAAFNAATKPDGCVGVLPRDVSLRAMCSLTLGRSSSLYRWDEVKGGFVPVLHSASVSGISLACSESAIKDLAEVGTNLINLRNFSSVTDMSQSRGQHPARVALQSCVGCILDGVEESISREMGHVQTILQLQASVTRPLRLLDMLASLANVVKECMTDESTISAIAEFVHVRVQATDEFCSILRVILAHVSVPWLEQLATDVGFRDSLHGLTATAVRVEHDASVKETSYSFLAPTDADLIRETRLALAIIQETSPELPILAYNPLSGRSPFDVLLDSTLQNSEVMDFAREYEENVTASFNGIAQPELNPSEAGDKVTPYSEDSVGNMWEDGAFKEGYIDGLSALMSQHLHTKAHDSSPELRKAVSAVLEVNTTTLDHPFILQSQEESSVSPIERIRPLLRTQHQLVNGVVLRQLLREHHLDDHLKLYRSFHLFGSGEFTDQVSTALFSPELQSAVRKRGVVPTSHQMGLRLGAADNKNWPPASSELCLILMGVLSRVTETWRSQQNEREASPDQWNHLAQAGGFTFAVRELSEEEIDRTMDMNSIHALDFLGLHYTAPAPVNHILAPEVTKHYDTIFRFLLLQQRILYMTAHFSRALLNQLTPERTAYLHLAHHITTTTLSHFMELGIEAPWRDLQSSLSTVMRNLAAEDVHGEIGTRATLGIDGLKRVHSVFLDRVRRRLFLKQKLAPLRVALEEAFAVILKGCVALQDDRGDFALEYKALVEAIGNFCQLLEEGTRKIPRSGGGMEIEGREAQRILLKRLRWTETE